MLQVHTEAISNLPPQCLGSAWLFHWPCLLQAETTCSLWQIIYTDFIDLIYNFCNFATAEYPSKMSDTWITTKAIFIFVLNKYQDFTCCRPCSSPNTTTMLCSTFCCVGNLQTIMSPHSNTLYLLLTSNLCFFVLYITFFLLGFQGAGTHHEKSSLISFFIFYRLYTGSGLKIV